MRGLGTRIVMAIVMASTTIAACGDGDGRVTVALPIDYQQLDLGDPLGATATFSAAFAGSDYITAGLVLHPSTQATMRQAATTDQFWAWTLDEARPTLSRRLAEESAGNDYFLDTLRLFEVSMQEAVASGALRIDLTGGLRDLALRSRDAFTAVVDANLTANDERVEVELGLSPGGAWRVRQIRLVGAPPQELPFGGRTNTAMAPSEVDQSSPLRQQILSPSPEQTIEMVSALIDVGDHLSLYLILSGAAQARVATALEDNIGQQGAEHVYVGAALDEALDISGFPYDLDELEEIGEIEVHAGAGVTTATTTVRTVNAELRIVLTEDSGGSWRLHQVLGDGADPNIVPFAVG